MSRILIAEAVELCREALRAASYTTTVACDELDARVRATVLSTADLRLDPCSRTAFLADREVRLTARELTLVERSSRDWMAQMDMPPTPSRAAAT